MNGAEKLICSLSDAGVGLCLANPGTTEMQFVRALDRVGAIRAVLGLSESVVSGAADGYARMKGRPALSLLHMAPGLANAGANLHNARKARTPILNIVGNHATRHLRYDAPLTADVTATAGVFSDWVRNVRNDEGMAHDAIEGLAVATGHPGRIATLIVPADIGENHVADPQPVPAVAPEGPRGLDPAVIRQAVAALGPGAAIICSGSVLEDPATLGLLAGIADKTGAELLSPAQNRRIERGAGRVSIPRLPYPVGEAIARLSHFRRAILIETAPPVAFFAWPDHPSLLLPRECEIIQLAEYDQDGCAAVAALADVIGARAGRLASGGAAVSPPASGPVTEATLAAAIAAALPEGAILVDEGMSRGRLVEGMTTTGAPHSWLSITGGAMGIGLPLAAGAAIACPDRPVIVMQSDGAAMFTLEALWTQAREGSNVTTIIFANRGYEMLRAGADAESAPIGSAARDLIDLDRPGIDFVSLARGMGVPGTRIDDAAMLYRTLAAVIREPGPFLMEVML